MQHILRSVGLETNRRGPSPRACPTSVIGIQPCNRALPDARDAPRTMELAVTMLTSLLLALAVYMAIGVALGAIFVTRLIGRVDPVARGSGPVFRLLILPGVAALWPWMLAKSLRAWKVVNR